MDLTWSCLICVLTDPSDSRNWTIYLYNQAWHLPTHLSFCGPSCASVLISFSCCGDKLPDKSNFGKVTLFWHMVWKCWLPQQERHSRRSVWWPITLHPQSEHLKCEVASIPGQKVEREEGWFSAGCSIPPSESVCDSILCTRPHSGGVTPPHSHSHSQTCSEVCLPGVSKSSQVDEDKPSSPWVLPIFMTVKSTTHNVPQTQLLREANYSLAIWSEQIQQKPSIISREHVCPTLFPVLFDHYNMP